MIKIGDKVRYTGKNEYDLTNGGIYTVSHIYGDREWCVLDDAGDENSAINDHFEKVESEDIIHDCYYAEQAAKHGIKITVTIGDMSFTYDGTK